MFRELKILALSEPSVTDGSCEASFWYLKGLRVLNNLPWDNYSGLNFKDQFSQIHDSNPKRLKQLFKRTESNLGRSARLKHQTGLRFILFFKDKKNAGPSKRTARHIKGEIVNRSSGMIALCLSLYHCKITCAWRQDYQIVIWDIAQFCAVHGKLFGHVYGEVVSKIG